MKMRYKICFHLSSPSFTGKGRYHSKMHYCGNTIEEAVSSMFNRLAYAQKQGRYYCTSMWLMRGAEAGEPTNIKWADYVKRPEVAPFWNGLIEGKILRCRYKRVDK